MHDPPSRMRWRRVVWLAALGLFVVGCGSPTDSIELAEPEKGGSSDSTQDAGGPRVDTRSNTAMDTAPGGFAAGGGSGGSVGGKPDARSAPFDRGDTSLDVGIETGTGSSLDTGPGPDATSSPDGGSPAEPTARPSMYAVGAAGGESSSSRFELRIRVGLGASASATSPNFRAALVPATP